MHWRGPLVAEVEVRCVSNPCHGRLPLGRQTFRALCSGAAMARPRSTCDLPVGVDFARKSRVGLENAEGHTRALPLRWWQLSRSALTRMTANAFQRTCNSGARHVLRAVRGEKSPVGEVSQDVSVHIGEAAIDAVVIEGQPLVIKA